MPFWDSAVGEPTTEPERFVSVLFEKLHGRLAYLYDAIATLDEPHARFAVNAWTADLETRRDRFKALVDITAETFPEFNPVERPLTESIFAGRDSHRLVRALGLRVVCLVSLVRRPDSCRAGGQGRCEEVTSPHGGGLLLLVLALLSRRRDRG